MIKQTRIGTIILLLFPTYMRAMDLLCEDCGIRLFGTSEGKKEAKIDTKSFATRFLQAMVDKETNNKPYHNNNFVSFTHNLKTLLETADSKDKKEEIHFLDSILTYLQTNNDLLSKQLVNKESIDSLVDCIRSLKKIVKSDWNDKYQQSYCEILKSISILKSGLEHDTYGWNLYKVPVSFVRILQNELTVTSCSHKGYSIFLSELAKFLKILDRKNLKEKTEDFEFIAQILKMIEPTDDENFPKEIKLLSKDDKCIRITTDRLTANTWSTIAVNEGIGILKSILNEGCSDIGHLTLHNLFNAVAILKTEFECKNFHPIHGFENKITELSSIEHKLTEIERNCLLKK